MTMTVTPYARSDRSRRNAELMTVVEHVSQKILQLKFVMGAGVYADEIASQQISVIFPDISFWAANVE